ncbi:Dcp1p-Dcp2p decapping enzyme complex alpha subunit [Rhizophlyctis rosea]|nr:Dcp1p-Dcp2p decapping enzyme complex alpha subunit [Rhizophlyctis rosea]
MNPPERQYFQIDLKPLQLSYGISKVFEDIETLKHGNDGLIFTSSVAPYSVGTCEKMLKWKPSEENTVDFRVIDVDQSNSPPLYAIALKYGGGRQAYDGEVARILANEEDAEEWARNPPIGKIIECRYDPSRPGAWKFARFRDDKDTPNHATVYDKIMQSIKDNVDKDTLLRAAPDIRTQWKIRNNEPL